MQKPAGAGQPPFALVLLGSYALAGAAALAVSVTWIEGFVWVGGAFVVAWIVLVGWAFLRFAERACWALLGVLALNPVTLFAGGLTYACAVKAACL